MSARLVITGASGQLGRRVAELVLAQGSLRQGSVASEARSHKCSHKSASVILVTRNPRALDSLAAQGADVRHGDFSEPGSLRAAFAGGERLLLVSATDLQHRTAQHATAIAAAKAAGVQHVIYTSGLAPAPPNPAVVAPSHYATEQALATSGLRWTVLRNSLYADYQLAEATRAIETGVLVHNRGDGRVAYVAHEDCAAAAAAMLIASGHEGQRYDITGPEAFSAADLATLYAELGGKSVTARALDDAAFVAGLVGGAAEDDHLRYGAELVASFGRSIREGYMESCTDSVARLTGRAARPLRSVLEVLRSPW
ncbi:MAG TPA: NAD(P)H-binding protein [Gammaproteobacteria bacterium]